MKRTCFSFGLLLLVLTAAGLGADLRIGMIGLDTSHVIAFTKAINDASSPDHVPGGKVVAAFKGGSPDLKSSASRVDKYTAELQEKYQVQLVERIADLCSRVDAILLESVDGRPHLEQARQAFQCKKPVFIDKPLAASYEDAARIFALGKETGTPWFSSSSLRYTPSYQKARAGEIIGKLHGAASSGPAHLEPTNPGFFWYGIHAVESLYTVMGPGCEKVSMSSTENYDVAVGVWKDGRVGTVRGLRAGKEAYSLLLFGEKGVEFVPAGDFSYVPLVRQIMEFFQTRKPPVPNEETLEIMAFIDAAERSRKQGGGPVALPR